MKVGDTVRVRQGWPFAGQIGQAQTHQYATVWQVMLNGTEESTLSGRGLLVSFREEQLEIINEEEWATTTQNKAKQERLYEHAEELDQKEKEDGN